MNSQSDPYQIIVMALISGLTGIYAIWTGILAIGKQNIKTPTPYKLGAFISRKIRGEARTSQFEKEIDDPKIAVRYGILWLLIGLIFLGGSILLLFTK